MATFGQAIRRGLPRVRGGEPWPPAGAVPPRQSAGVADADPQDAAGEQVTGAAALALPRQIAGVAGGGPQIAAGEEAAVSATVDADEHAGSARVLRRGLPRVHGGEPWPPADVVPPRQGAGVTGGDPQDAAGERVAGAAASVPPRQGVGAEAADSQDAAGEPETGAAATVPPRQVAGGSDDGAQVAAGERMLRRGLPRVAGGDPWPPAGVAPIGGMTAAVDRAVVTAEPDVVAPAAAESADGVAPAMLADAPAAADSALAPAAPAAAASAALEPATDISVPLPFTRTVWEGRYARTRPAPAPEPTRIGPFTRVQWLGAVIVGGGGLLFAAAMAVFAVRWLLSTDPFQDFLATYPGEYHLPEGAPVGFPAWLGWQHFFNVFLMVLIIRSGLQVRTEKRPSAFWSRRGSKRKISLNLWFHQSLDILWLVNGVAFVVLLFVTGQWMRIVPTSWEVFPNALSAALQYVSLDWPTENGWVNYNALQQLAYFTTVFIAAPLAAITGVRMSGIWPKNAQALNKAYPVEWARAVHFPVMLYFVLFIFVHVVLVFATGALRNLNHMYAAQGSVDPDAYATNWAGFWIFSVSILVIAGAWAAARPLVLAPIARLFGSVSGR